MPPRPRPHLGSFAAAPSLLPRWRSPDAHPRKRRLITIARHFTRHSRY